MNKVFEAFGWNVTLDKGCFKVQSPSGDQATYCKIVSLTETCLHFTASNGNHVVILPKAEDSLSPYAKQQTTNFMQI